MKKILLFLVCIIIITRSFSQVLSDTTLPAHDSVHDAALRIPTRSA